MEFNDKGEEVLDPTPLAMPLGYRRPPSLAETISRMIRGEMSKVAQASGYESFEEADDFDVMDENDGFASKHEMTQMQEEYLNDPRREKGVAGPPKGGKERAEDSVQPTKGDRAGVLKDRRLRAEDRGGRRGVSVSDKGSDKNTSIT